VVVLVPEHAEARGNEIANNLARGGSVQRSVGSEPSWGSQEEHKKKDKTLDGQPEFGNMTWTLQHKKAGSRIECRTQFGHKGMIIVFNRS